jgi:iron complex transport system substrate-binding protein
VLTQELCEVCAVSYSEVQQSLKLITGEQKVISLEPKTLGDILENIVEVGRATGREAEAKDAVLELGQRVKRVAQACARVTQRPRVFFWEWLDPIYIGGHWIPGMIELAGGKDGLGTGGVKSRVGTWDEVEKYRPEVILLSPCGYDVDEVLERFSEVTLPPFWKDLPAVRSGKVYAVNASAYFARPGPRAVDGLEILAGLIHPELGLREIGPDEARGVA